MPFAYWLLLLTVAVVTLIRMADALLILRAQANGLALVWIPLVLVVYNIVYAISVYPTGLLGNRLGQRGLLIAGILCLALSQTMLASTEAVGLLFWSGIALWGLHMGLTQGLLTARVAQLTPPALRGTSFGLFHLITGMAQLLAGLGFGWLWMAYSAAVAFQVAAMLSLLALPLIWVALRESSFR